MIEPLRMSFVVACPPDHAFATWTAKASAWWPKEHTASHEPNVEIVFEPNVGGRIFALTPAGEEIDWGEIVEWDPPRRLRYRWHIAIERANATDVEIVFHALPGAATRIEIEHGGWDRLGAVGQTWREANHAGWDGVLPGYIAGCES